MSSKGPNSEGQSLLSRQSLGNVLQAAQVVLGILGFLGISLNFFSKSPPDKPEAQSYPLIFWGSVGCVLFIIALQAYRGRWIPEIYGRFSHLDVRSRPLLWRAPFLLGGLLFRMLARAVFSWVAVLVVFAAFLAISGAVALHFAHAWLFGKPATASLASGEFVTLVSTLFVIAVAAGFMLDGIVQSSRLRDSQKVLRLEVIEQLERYSQPVTTNETPKSADELRTNILRADSGNIGIQAVNAAQLMLANDNSPSPLDEAFARDSNRKIFALLGHPMSNAIRWHNRLIYGRYREFYARRFVEVALRWKREFDERGKNCRLFGRLYWHFPTHRLTISSDRALVQRYWRFRCPRNQPPLMVFRVYRHNNTQHFSCAVQELNSKTIIAKAQKQLKEDVNCVKDDIIGARLVSLRVSDPRSLYGHFYHSFESEWNDAELDFFPTLWDSDRLAAFAALCGVERAKREVLRSRKDELLLEICKMLEVGAELKALQFSPDQRTILDQLNKQVPEL